MKKVMVLLALVVFAGGIIFISNDAAFARRKDKDSEKDKEEVKKVEEAIAAPTGEEPRLIYTFKDSEEMGGFEQLYVAKQATFGRMGVLQAYFAMEQNNLTEIDRQMEEKFGFRMDPNKIYDLNRDTKEIREVGPTQSPAPLPAAAE